MRGELGAADADVAARRASLSARTASGSKARSIRGLRARGLLERRGVHDLLGAAPDLRVVAHHGGLAVGRHRLPDDHDLVHPAAVEVGPDRPLVVVDERVDLVVGRRPVEVAVLVGDVAVERGDRRVDQLGHGALDRTEEDPRGGHAPGRSCSTRRAARVDRRRHGLLLVPLLAAGFRATPGRAGRAAAGRFGWSRRRSRRGVDQTSCSTGSRGCSPRRHAALRAAARRAGARLLIALGSALTVAMTQPWALILLAAPLARHRRHRARARGDDRRTAGSVRHRGLVLCAPTAASATGQLLFLPLLLDLRHGSWWLAHGCWGGGGGALALPLAAWAAASGRGISAVSRSEACRTNCHGRHVRLIVTALRGAARGGGGRAASASRRRPPSSVGRRERRDRESGHLHPGGEMDDERTPETHGRPHARGDGDP